MDMGVIPQGRSGYLMIGEDAEAGNRTVDPCEGNEGCHCEERSDTAISIVLRTLDGDCFASLAMTAVRGRCGRTGCRSRLTDR
jgi:hypothetical protein